jgi:hypothetical protein
LNSHDWKGHEGWAQLTKQPGEEGARHSVILSLLVDHSLFVHPEQQAQLKNNLPAYTVGSLRAHVQVSCLLDVIDDLVSSENPQDQLKRFTQALHDVFAFSHSKKHMIQRQLGRFEPTPWLGSSRLSKRTTTRVLDDLFGVPMSVGTVSQSEKTTTEVLAKPVADARGYVKEQSVAHLDGTSWREAGQRAWLWVAVTSLVTVFVVRLSRSGRVARELLGETFSGILVTDRYSGYNWYAVRWRQLCWSHVLRDFEAIRG